MLTNLSRLGRRLTDAGFTYTAAGEFQRGEHVLSHADGTVVATGSPHALEKWLDEHERRAAVLNAIDELSNARFHEGYAAARGNGMHRIAHRQKAKALFATIVDLLPPGMPGEGN